MDNKKVKRPYNSEVKSPSIPIKVIFNKGGQEMPILLSRAGFFDKFSITFNQKEEKITLKKLE